MEKQTEKLALEPKIVAFTCNWCAYAGADYAGVSRISYPPSVRIIRVMCSGRVEPAFILKAFEQGAWGVFVGGCHEADCHYKTGNLLARERVEETKKLLDLLGIGSERLRLKWVNANEGDMFAWEISDFVQVLKKLGPTPLKEITISKQAKFSLEETISNTEAYSCVECGKCTGICPVARRSEEFSPRRLVELALERMEAEIETKGELWECLTCGLCEEKCPFSVRFSHFVREFRAESRTLDGEKGTKSGLMFSWMRIMANEGIKQNRTSWTEGMKTKGKATSKSDIMYFVGCLPYYNISHSAINPGSLDIAKNTLSILNVAGITPVILSNERCCGHDPLVAGDFDTFEKLARINAREIKNSGVKRIVVSCPECYETLSIEYPKVIKGWDIEVMHISELTSELAEKGKISFASSNDLKVTFQDPCRLGRIMGVYDAPRNVLNSIPNVTLVEMEHSRNDALCCGVSAWVNCGATSKQIQLDRITEAKSTGANLIVTACPKCLIHFRCALSAKTPEGMDPEFKVEDLTSIVAKALADSRAEKIKMKSKQQKENVVKTSTTKEQKQAQRKGQGTRKQQSKKKES